jgi:hypothetical protein
MSREGAGAEKALASRGQELRLLVETIPTLVWRTGPEGNVESWHSHSKCASGVYPYAAPSGALTFVNKRTAD